MKAKITIELPPDVPLTEERRAALLSAVAKQLGCADHDHALAKADTEPKLKKLPHRAPQAWVDETAKRYEQLMKQMLDEISAALS